MPATYRAGPAPLAGPLPYGSGPSGDLSGPVIKAKRSAPSSRRQSIHPCRCGRVAGIEAARGVEDRVSGALNCGDGEDDLVVVDRVDDPILATSGGPVAGQVTYELLADAVGVLGQRPVDELPYSGRDRFGQGVLDRSSGGGGPADAVGHGRRSSSVSSTVVPASISPRAWARSAIRVGSERISTVSSRAARSSGEMRTAAGSPLRVITTRSCVSCTEPTIADRCALTWASEVVVDMT